MTNSEQGQSPWTDEQIVNMVAAHTIHTRDEGGCVRAHEVRILMRQERDAWAADRTALIERGDALYQSGMSDERDHQNALSRRVEEMHKQERNALIEANQQSDKDWLAMYRAIAQTTADAAEWELADDATLMEEFDPWDALRALVAERDALRERVAMSKRMVWLPLDGGMNKTPCSCGNCTNHFGLESETLLTLFNGKDRVSVVLPDDIRLCRQVEAQPLPDGVREAIGICANYGMPLGITYAQYNAAREIVTAWLDEQEGNSESA